MSKIAKEYTLTAGHYTVGIDIPSGKCDVVAESGTGNLSSSNMFTGGINEMFGVDKGNNMYTKEFKGLKLPKEVVLSVTSNLKIKLTYTTIDGGFSGRTYDDSKKVTLKSGNYTAGTDFPVGVYKVVAVKGDGNISSSNMFDGGLNEMFGVTANNMYNKQFLNVEFDKGIELTISGGLTVELTPSK